MAPDTSNNSYLLEVDGTCFTVGNNTLPANAWTWVDYQNAATASKISMNLSAGSHTVKLIGSEPSVKIDRILAVSDATCVPTGFGDNCTVEADTTAPAAALTAPADNASVSGTVNVAVTATDAKGVSKVEFYVDNALKATDTSAPYSYSWDTAGVANGTHAIMVKAYDAAGNVGSDSTTVSVRNGDSQAPTAPTQVAAVANAYNKVTLTWKAATDNVAVSGYVISRNGTPVATVGAVTSYTDNTVVAGQTYAYAVASTDAAGNKSGAGTVSVTTPAAPVSDTQAPTAPSNVTATAQSTSQINLAWTASTDNTGVAGYDVYRANVGGNPARIITVTTPGYSDTGLNSGTQYSYYVIAKDAKGNMSSQSATVLATTQVPPTQPEEPEDPGEEPAVEAGAVRGKVTDRRGDGIGNVTVSVWAEGKRYSAMTNKRGVYRIEDLPAGRTTIKFTKSGYETDYTDVKVREGKDAIKNITLAKKNQRGGWWGWFPWWR